MTRPEIFCRLSIELVASKVTSVQVAGKKGVEAERGTENGFF